MHWKQYEDEIFDHFRNEFPSARIVRDVRVPGRFSQVERQVDILIDDTVAGFDVRIAIDAKHHNKRLDVTDVEAFLGFCNDIDAHKGVLISLMGYTKAATNRAHYDESDIELDVLNFAELKRFQAFSALAYAGGHGVVLPAPFGWIVDGKRQLDGSVATLYQRGYDLKQAQQAHEWMYVNFWIKKDDVTTLEILLAHQESYLLTKFSEAKITYLDGPARKVGVTKIRRFEEKTYPVPEYTGFVVFDEFIFFCVMFTPPEFANRNLRKLNYILRSVIPFRLKEPGPNPAVNTDPQTA
jgi:Restriction endonuclease